MSKKSEKNEDAEDGRVHTKENYKLRITRDTEKLPDGITEELIPDMAATNAEIDIHWSSKTQLSSPTTLELSCKVTHGRFNFDLEGKLKTSSPWVFAPFDISDAKDLENYEINDLDQLKEKWIQKAEEAVVRIPEEIKPDTTPVSNEKPAEGQDETTSEENDADNGDVNLIETDPNETEADEINPIG